MRCNSIWCGADFVVADEDIEFYKKISPSIHEVSYAIPLPKKCPDCRSQQRMLWRNERCLYANTCTQCRKSIICMYHAKSGYKVLCEECWHTDSANPKSFAQDIQNSVSFFTQFDSLLRSVPHRGLYITGTSENSNYVNWAGPCKNCYLVFNSGLIENCYYSKGLLSSKDCMDMLTCQKCERCYECSNCSESYELLYSHNCNQCSSSSYLFNCIGCTNCFLCSNQSYSSYRILNKQYTKHEYEIKKSKLLQHGSFVSACELESMFKDLVAHSLHKESQNVQTENCTGDYLFNCKDCRRCFELSFAEDCAYIDCSKRCTSSQDLYGYGYDSEQLFQCVGVGYSFHVLWSVQVERCSDCLYCFQCNDSTNLFGCVGLRHAEYCIFNKQYSKQEYARLVPELIEMMKKGDEWGSFFPAILSPFTYNQPVCNEYFPLSKQEALQQGFRWFSEDLEISSVTKSIPAKDLPDSIESIPDDILQWSLICEQTDHKFKIQKSELEFYRSLDIPIPRHHPNQRHVQRIQKRNPRTLYDRECGKCSKNMQTTYSPERPEIVYCKECYLAEVY